MRSLAICFILLFSSFLNAEIVKLGIDNLFEGKNYKILKGKKIGLIANHTSINDKGEHTVDILKKNEKRGKYKLVALFAPEHGFKGLISAGQIVKNGKGKYNLPIYSLHGETRRPTKKMLKNIDVLVYDIQDIGSRSYTYISTLFYAMEEAKKNKVKVVVLDRPNPIGAIVDGPMLGKKWRSFVGYVNVPYCHGMTVCELALFFNREYKIKCDLKTVPMTGWKRTMNFKQTGLFWIPTSPNIPNPDSPYYYPTTGILGELQMVDIGIGYMPFQVVVAPFIKSKKFAKALNKQKFAGVRFEPISCRPPRGRFKGQICHGVQIKITDHKIYKPIETQYLILGILKSLYPRQFAKAFKKSSHRKEMFCKVTGTSKIYNSLKRDTYIVWKLKNFDKKKRESFLKKRKSYLIYN